MIKAQTSDSDFSAEWVVGVESEINANYVCVFIPSPVRVGTLLKEVPGTQIGASFFEFELKPTGKDSADPTQHEFQHHIL